MSEFDDLETLESEWHSKKNFFSLFCTGVGRQSENREVRKIAEKLRKIAENCEKLRKIAKNCEIAENCEKLRTSIPPPPLLWFKVGCSPRHTIIVQKWQMDSLPAITDFFNARGATRKNISIFAGSEFRWIRLA